METNVGYSYHLPSGGWNYKIRNTLSQFSDLFSEFNKYIAPAYHHDRCERSVQMRVYSMHKGEFVMVFVAFFACFGLGVFIGLAGPSPTTTTSITASSALTNASDIYRGPFHLHSPTLGTRVQQLWLLAEILTDNNDEEIFDKSFQVSISIDGVLSDHTTTNLVPESEATNKTIHLKCMKQVCEEVMVLHLGSLDYMHYVLNIRFYGLKEFHKRYYIRDIIFYFKTYNPSFTQMETWFRFIFLLTTFVVSCWFAHTLRKFSTQDWAIEQKWLSILLPLLLLFNDPIFPLRLVSGSWFAPLVDAVFQTTFLACVMLSWLALYHGLRQNERNFVSFYLFKLIVVGLIWTPAMVLTIWQKYYAYEDPTFNYIMNPNYSFVKIMFFCAITLYFLYLLVLIIKAYSDLRNMPFFDIRLRCLSLVVGTVTFFTTILALQNWGPGALQDHWASQPKVHYDTSAPFMAMYGLFNFKMYILAYLFSPGGNSIHETSITKDNPAFSMINDSDEEVIYGSDEESRRPLNSHHRVNEEI
ncbi:transmembrane protein 181 [Hyposmocoma kahamanoa]|uniref:transmembrane protein 181 n=1 Tax=Hyposmocoma kahamanoa TaxID=1477025 RepID=UPI000E6D728D|nr:transmembrane protein 181 [Hyposmocoma kahamanoa]